MISFRIFNDHLYFLLIVSDRCSAGETDDKSGLVLRELVSKHFGATITSALVPDEIDKIEVRYQNQWSNIELFAITLFC